MADHAFAWARARGLVSKNPIHGEEEADIPLDKEWTRTTESGNRTEFQGVAAMDVSC